MKRIGKMNIPNNIVEEENFPDVLATMQFIPLRVEYLAYRDQFEYIGISPMFDELPLYLEPETYLLIVTTTEDNKIEKVEVKKEL